MLAHLPQCYIEITVPWWGLGALITSTTSHLLRCRGIPTIGWWSQWYTREDRPKTNIYEWFWDQPAPHVVHYLYREWDLSVFAANERRSKELVAAARQRWWEVIGPQADKTGCFQAAVNLLMQAKQPGVLGVHYRGTDKRSETPVPPIPALIENIKAIQRDSGLQTLLICTDDQTFLTECCAVFPHLLYFKQHLRVAGVRGLHEQLGSPRQCVETMIEILALGLCNHLYLGRSCVADAALFLSRADLTWEYYN